LNPLLIPAAIALAVAAILFIVFMRYEAGNVVLETIKLTDANENLRILHISDVHIKLKTVPTAKITLMIRDSAPDIVVMTGDYINRPKDVRAFLAWMGEIAAAAGGAGIYMCYGNHDAHAFIKSPDLKRELTKRLKQMGAYVLENRSLTFTHRERLYTVTGFTDYFAQRRNGVRQALKDAPKGAHYHIGISHNPDIALELDGPRPDLLLLGHFHGGQIWLPFHLEYTCLRREYLCKLGVRKGLHSFGGRLLYISRGLGCVLFPLRLGSRPEITLLIVP